MSVNLDEKIDNYNKFKSESGHWYDQDGEPMYTIIGANGKHRNTTLRDAKNLGLVPSVTTIIGIAAKPALENWKLTQAIKSAQTLSLGEEETLDSFVFRCKADANDISYKAAQEGTRIHALIESGFRGEQTNSTYTRVLKFLDEHFPNETWIAEDSFCARQGYGGKIDLYSKSGIFVDFKTKDNLEGKDPAKLVYDDHGMQLSAYAQGCDIVRPERVSIFVDRKDTQLVLGHVWDKKTHKRHKDMFNSLLKYWQLVKNYEWKTIKENKKES
tara:strand:+ start:6225 stop:7037 length:813 start_codon:yes stop_codon:yes gene_type:complete